MKKIINHILSLYNYIIVNNSNYQKNNILLQKTIKDNLNLRFQLLCKFSKNPSKLQNEFKNSKSQSLQDLFVLNYLNFKKKGFF